ncbi:YdhK family protein [Brevibacterium sp. UCMA 11754]|uniref:YdhK family protein n=1 Tax=Brevibacterium sp. UCMA 11754 TaxID=2749198 RepID=UPI001F465185|nr:YdhK family protein [Brevibacterium sp. UCMA 11754]MCF2572661.1 YdhK family protein [Brevibacterium sp. UCMA 11754]
MKTSTPLTTIAAVAAASALLLSGCASSEGDEAAQHPQHEKQSESASSEDHGESHEHAADGGQPPKGIEKASDPNYAVGDEVALTADHMPGMKGAKATISGAFDTTTYSVSYSPTDGGDPVKDHRWVVHEELKNPGKAPLKDGAKATLNADHMPGMKGAEATIDSSTENTVYMVDIDTDDMTMTNHKWVTEDEVQPVR